MKDKLRSCYKVFLVLLIFFNVMRVLADNSFFYFILNRVENLLFSTRYARITLNRFILKRRQFVCTLIYYKLFNSSCLCKLSHRWIQLLKGSIVSFQEEPNLTLLTKISTLTCSRRVLGVGTRPASTPC